MTPKGEPFVDRARLPKRDKQSPRRPAAQIPPRRAELEQQADRLIGRRGDCSSRRCGITPVLPCLGRGAIRQWRTE